MKDMEETGPAAARSTREEEVLKTRIIYFATTTLKSLIKTSYLLRPGGVFFVTALLAFFLLWPDENQLVNISENSGISWD